MGNFSIADALHSWMKVCRRFRTTAKAKGSRSTQHTGFSAVPVAEGMTQILAFLAPGELPICPRQAGTDGLLLDVLPAWVYSIFDVCCKLDHNSRGVFS